MRKILPYISWLLFIIIMVVLLSFVNHAHNALDCTAISIHINQNDENFFVEETDIESMLPFDLSKTPAIPVATIDVENIEKKLNSHPAIKNAEVYLTLEGKLTIFVDQRKPIARVFTDNQKSYYIDESGYLMPLSAKFSSRVMIISGHIHAPYSQWYNISLTEVMANDSLRKNTMLDDLFKLSEFIYKNDFWKAQIEHLYVNKDLEVELIPRVGSHTIVLGEIKDIEKKFDKLLIFYREGLSKTGWNEYSSINLKFENQVVCTKRFN